MLQLKKPKRTLRLRLRTSEGGSEHKRTLLALNGADSASRQLQPTKLLNVWVNHPARFVQGFWTIVGSGWALAGKHAGGHMSGGVLILQ